MNNKLSDTNKQYIDNLKNLEEQIKNQEKVIFKQQKELLELRKSIELSKALKIARALKRTKRAISPSGIRHASKLSKKGIVVLTTLGPSVFLLKAKNYLRQQYIGITSIDINQQYEIWVKNHTLTQDDFDRMDSEIKTFKYNPLISILVPVYNVDEQWLRKCIESVQNQLYKNWELCIVDDASPKPHIKKVLDEYKLKDKRIKVIYSKINQHISLTTNEGLSIATGEFVALMDNDDELPKETLFEIVKVLNSNKELDFIYSDEDLMTLEGKRVNPIFKPDWSPETTMSMMYTTHFGVYRKSIFEKIGGCRKGFEGSQDYDLVLRFVEQTKIDRIYHIPKVLYHWRMIPGSTAVNYGDKSYARDAARKALKEMVERRKIDGEIQDGLSLPSFRLKRRIKGNPKVSIIIPTKDHVEDLKRCINSIEEKTIYPNYEIIIVDNNSKDIKTLNYLNEIKKYHTILNYNKPFNYSAINNYAVEHATGEHILLLNNDTEVINIDWLNSLLELSQVNEYGAIGAKLLYPDNKIQHAGIILGVAGPAGHSHKMYLGSVNGYMDRISIIQNISAVTGACLMVKKKLYKEVGGLDENNLAVAYNDVDFCLKLMDKGYRNIYTPFAQLYHFESKTRGLEDSIEKIGRLNKEAQYVTKKWIKYINNDPYYNPNLSREKEDFSLNLFN